MASEPVCARCPRVLGRTCCEPREGDALATLTAGDIQRIEAETGRSRRFFLEEEWLSHEETFLYERVRPLFRGYFARHPARLTLKRSSRGACVFHAAGRGCTLSSEARPLACRLYPFEVLLDGTWGLAVGQGEESGCLAVDESGSLEELQRHFGIEQAQLERWATQLKEEIPSPSGTKTRYTHSPA